MKFSGTIKISIGLVVAVSLAVLLLFTGVGTSLQGLLLSLSKPVYAESEPISIIVQGSPSTSFILIVLDSRGLETYSPNESFSLDKGGNAVLTLPGLMTGNYTIKIVTSRFVVHTPLEVSGVSGHDNVSFSPPVLGAIQTNNTVLARNIEESCANGICTQTIYSFPKYYLRRGEWIEWDESLQPCRAGFCSANDFNITLKRFFNGSVMNLSFFGSYITFGNFSFASRKMQPVLGVVDENRITYPNVLPGVNVTYYSVYWGVKEVISIENRNVLRLLPNFFNFSVPIDFSGTSQRGSRGGVRFKNGTRNVFNMDPIIIQDSAGKLVDIINLSLSSGKLTFVLNKTRLVSPNVTFPIFIDPSVNLDDSDVYWDGHIQCSNCDGEPPTYTRFNLTTISVGGEVGDSKRYRGAIEWNVSSILDSSNIIEIKMTYRVTTLGDGGNFSFNQMVDNSGTYPDTSGGNENFYTDMGNGTTYGIEIIASGTKTVNLSSSAFQDMEFELNDDDIFGIGMTSTEELTGSTSTLIASSENGFSPWRPALLVTYKLNAPNITLNSPANNSFLNPNKDIILNVTPRDLDAPFTGETALVEIYGSSSPIPTSSDLLHKVNVSFGTDIEYNWSVPVITADNYTILLLHLDNRSEFGENNTIFFDFGINQTNGSCTPEGCPTFNESGRIGGAFKFDGINDNITFSVTPSLPNSFTYMAWIWPNSSDASGALMVEDFNTGIFFKNTTGLIDFFYSASSHESSTALTFYGWNHVAVVNNAGSVTFYLNGIADGTASSAPGFFVQWIGDDDDDASKNFGGYMDEIVALNRSMTAQEVQDSYSLSKGKYYWIVNVSDGTFSNTTGILAFTKNQPPEVTLNSPANNSEYNYPEIVLNVTMIENDPEDVPILSIYGSNETSPGTKDLLYRKTNAPNNTFITYNWSAPIQKNHTDVQLLFHFDNRSEFGENDTWIYDFTGNYNGSVQQGSPSFNETGGKIAGALTLGNSDRIKVVGCGFECYKLRNATYMGWLKVNNSGDLAGIISSFAASGPVGFSIGKNGPQLFVIGDQLLGVFDNDFFTDEVGRWVHFAVTTAQNGSNYTTRLYKNGQITETGNITAVTDLSSVWDFWIGEYDAVSSSFTFNGSIDEIAIINRTFSDEEVQDSYRLKSGVYHWYANATDGTNTNYSGKRQFTVGSIPPFNITFIPPTASNNSNLSQTSYTVNVSFNESSPSGCLLQETCLGVFGGGCLGPPFDVVNITMILSGNTCVKTRSASNTMLSYRVYVNDSAGNGNWSVASRIVSLDTVNPKAGNISANESQVRMPQVFNINATANDIGVGVRYVNAYNGSSVSMVMGVGDSWSVNTTASALGCTKSLFECTIRINATDYAGNENTTETLLITILNRKPNITLNAPANDSTVSLATLNVTVFEDDPEDRLLVKIYGSNSSQNLREYIVFQETNVSNGTTLLYNWTHPVQKNISNVTLLVHLDNNSDFGENDTLVVDFSGNINGTVFNNAIPNMSGGILGGAYEFNGGSDAYILFTNTNAPAAPMTVVMWINLYQGDISGDKAIFGEYGNSEKGFVISSFDQTSLNLSVDSNKTQIPEFFTAGKWVHIAISLNDSSNGMAKIYKNGVLEGTFLYDSFTNIPPDTGGMGIGFVDNTIYDRPSATVDDLAVYSRNLSADEIMDLYRLKSGTYYWNASADDGSNTTNNGTYQFDLAFGYLEVFLNLPNVSTLLNVVQNSTFTMNASVYCRGIGDCENVFGYARYNSSGSIPNVQINSTQGGKPLYVLDVSNKGCPDNILSNGEFCNITWSVNATGNITSHWSVGVLFNSSNTNVPVNHTENATLNIIPCVVDFVTNFSSIEFGVQNPSGGEVEASKNPQGYDIIINPGSCNTDIYIKSTNLTNSSLSTYIPANNISFLNDTGTEKRYPFSESYKLLRDNVNETHNIATEYYLNIPAVFAGIYQGIITYTGVETGDPAP